MTRHSKHSTALPVYTKYERKIDSKDGQYGLQKMRVPKEGLRQFDCCSLSLQRCVNPVISKYGDIFEKESIYNYLFETKKLIKERLERQKLLKEEEEKEILKQKEYKEKHRFENSSKLIKINNTSNNNNNNYNPEFDNENSETSLKSELHKPKLVDRSKIVGKSSSHLISEQKSGKLSKSILCPIRNKPLNISMLFDVKFNKIKSSKDHEDYVCALTQDILTNSTNLIYLKPSKAIITAKAFEKLVEKQMIDPIAETKLEKSDIIHVSRGATNYSASGNKLDLESQNASLTIA